MDIFLASNILKFFIIGGKSIHSQIISFLTIWMPYAVTSLMETAGMDRNNPYQKLIFTFYTGYTPQSSFSFSCLAIPTMIVKVKISVYKCYHIHTVCYRCILSYLILI